MRKFKALVQKDFYIAKKTLLMPLWITAGIYLLTLISMGIAAIKGDFSMYFFNGLEEMMLPAQPISYLAGYTILGFASFLCILFTILIAQGALNEDLRRNVELFHRSQPVSVWHRVLAKFSVAVLGNWLVMLIIGLVNLLIAVSLLIYVHSFSFGYLLVGFSQALLVMLKYGILSASIALFCSAIFKDKAFIKGLALVAGFNLFVLIVNVWFGWNLPNPWTYISKLINVEIFPRDISGMGDLSNLADLRIFISSRWQMILFNWQALIQMVVSAVLFVGGVLIYDHKEVK
jgi:hypothetical protein